MQLLAWTYSALRGRYWLGQAFSLGASQHTIFAELRKDAEGFVGTCADLTCRGSRKASSSGKWTVVEKSGHDSRCLLRTMGPKWEPSLFNKLCEDVLLFLGLGPFRNQVMWTEAAVIGLYLPCVL